MVNDAAIRIQMPCSMRYVSIARMVLKAIGRKFSLTQRQMDDMSLAVGEACANAVKYSNPCATPVVVEYRFTSHGLEIEVQNEGCEFDPEIPNTRPKHDELRVGGLGLYLINQCMDEMKICSRQGMNVLTMVKHVTL